MNFYEVLGTGMIIGVALGIWFSYGLIKLGGCHTSRKGQNI